MFKPAAWRPLFRRMIVPVISPNPKKWVIGFGKAAIPTGRFLGTRKP
jgi:hypothetical protein